MSDTEPTQPIDVLAEDEPVAEDEAAFAPGADDPAADAVDDDRRPWAPSQIRTRLKALDRVGRGGRNYIAKQVDALVDDAAFTVAWHDRRYANLADEHRRLKRDYRKLRNIEWELREQIKRYEHPEDYGRTPTHAIARVSGGRSHGEQIVTRAEEHAARIVANAEEDARRIRANARLEAQEAGEVPEPKLVDDGPRDLLARIQYLAAARPAAERRVASITAIAALLPEAEAHLAEVTDEQARYAEVLPIAVRDLPGVVIDVTEVGEPTEVAY